MKKIIHVNQHIIRQNSKGEERKPPLLLKTYKDTLHANLLRIVDDNGNMICEFIYRPDKPLSCGAKVWVEVASGYNVEVVS